ncbi:hypothetical protein SKZ59_11205 [Janthinobacterium sp. GMG2]|uniref:hypothetical protein n=1 Tax=Janthinobacterium sp. GMG2 TaxID=3096606 RepID=UPI0029F4CE33|nr:hypothetical protein [Janthinobacterium sp. GMG2]MDX8122345.1 hypothetical protein [Janthinobacterium sp. GMG2]
MLDYFLIISEYFEHFSEFSKTYLYSHFETNLPDQATTSSGDFEKVKKFYATCYEFYASAITIFTCANNIKNDRKYNQLRNIDFKKYLESDKSKRKENFKENEIFSNFSIEFDSTIRNASFHNWIRLNDDHTTIEFRSGGTGELQSMTYAEYLNKCSKLFFQICQLFKIELALTSNYS